MSEDLKINRPAEGGEPMAKVLRDGEGFDLSALRAAPAAPPPPPAAEEDEDRPRKPKHCPPDWWDDSGLYAEGS